MFRLLCFTCWGLSTNHGFTLAQLAIVGVTRHLRSMLPSSTPSHSTILPDTKGSSCESNCTAEPIRFSLQSPCRAFVVFLHGTISAVINMVTECFNALSGIHCFSTELWTSRIPGLFFKMVNTGLCFNALSGICCISGYGSRHSLGEFCEFSSLSIILPDNKSSSCEGNCQAEPPGSAVNRPKGHYLLFHFRNC